MNVNLTRRKSEILLKLLSVHIDPGTMVDIARQVDGNGRWRSGTFKFLWELEGIHCLTEFKDNSRRLGIRDGLKRASRGDRQTYAVDKDLICKLWRQRPEYRLSRRVDEMDVTIEF